MGKERLIYHIKSMLENLDERKLNLLYRIVLQLDR